MKLAVLPALRQPAGGVERSDRARRRVRPADNGPELVERSDRARRRVHPADNGPELVERSDRARRRVHPARASVAEPSASPDRPLLRGWKHLQVTAEKAAPPEARASISLSAEASARARLPLVTVQGAVADILMPAQGLSFPAYLTKLLRERIFPEQQAALTELLKTVPTSLRPFPGEAGRPRIGIIVAEPRDLLPKDPPQLARLVEAVRAMGADPVLIPPCLGLALGRSADVAAITGQLDGILGPGGADVDPRIYHARNTASIGTNYLRDRWEADLISAARGSALFLFGICRSHQLWNAASGGDLVQDVRKEGVSSVSQVQTDYGLAPNVPFVLTDSAGHVVFENRVELAPGSRIASAAGAGSLVTNSLHHQLVKRPGAGLEVVGRVFDPATGTSSIEATEAWNVITTQFHPELLGNDPAESHLLGTLGRRAAIFRFAKGHPFDLRQLLEWMGKDGRFDASDRRWATRDLAPRIT